LGDPAIITATSNHMSNARSHGESFDGIQYLRAIAALMVVAHHARYYFGHVGWSNVGMTGVDIFFIISGFIMVHATRDVSPLIGPKQQALDFFVRRAIRVIPLYWLALLYNSKRAIAEGSVGPGFIYDFLFFPRSNPDHAGAIMPSLPLGWTLNYEIVFYLLFGLSILFGSRRYVVLVSSIVAIVLAGTLWQFESVPLIFWTSSVFGEFALGVGVYFLVSGRKFAPSTTVAALVLLASFVGIALPNQGISRLFADGIFAAFIVWSGVYFARAIRPIKALGLLGDASYSIYLTHPFTLGPCYKMLNALGLSAPTPFNIVIALTFCTVASAGVGVAVHFLVEKPLLKWMLGIWRNRQGMRSRPALS
jgi:peptidoglycan/LPS O-acetylase OafA/YrhL